MNKMRRKLKQSERMSVYSKTNGHCAYCGCELTTKSMTVDHIVSLAHYNGKDELDNMFPACRSCNYYKSTLTLEKFRAAVEKFHDVLMRDSVTYKNAVRFGLVIPNPHKVMFYFEKIKEIIKCMNAVNSDKCDCHEEVKTERGQKL